MTYILTILKTALFDFSRNKGRTVLTSLGILIGVLSVVLLIAFGLGLKKYISDQFESLGSNNLRVLPGQILKGGGFRPSSAVSSISFDEKDMINLKRIKEVSLVIPVFTRSADAVVGKNTESTDLYMTTSDIFPGLNFKIQIGQLFTKTDNDKRSKVVVIGPKIAEKLFGTKEQALNNTVKVSGQKFRVIGVLEPKGGGGFGGPDLDSYIFMPYKTGFIFNSDKKFVTFIIKAKNNVNLDDVQNIVTDVLGKRYKTDEFSVIQQTEILNAVSSIFNILNAVLIAIAAISLVVGGIGIMNIMFVTVTERIKEIGIRRALGARKLDILLLFLVESVVLSLMGGLMGLILAFIIVFFIQSIFPAYINLQSVILALGVSTSIGVIFGVFPAKKAADLSPIEAIRYE